MEVSTPFASCKMLAFNGNKLLCLHLQNIPLYIYTLLFSSPGRSPGRAIVLPPGLASVSALASALAKC